MNQNISTILNLKHTQSCFSYMSESSSILMWVRSGPIQYPKIPNRGAYRQPDIRDQIW
jgi:hypothetical protein